MKRNSARWIAVMTFVSLAAVVLVGVADRAASAAEKVTLQLRLQEGKTYSLRMLMNQKMTQTMQNQKMDIDQVIGFGYAVNVEKVQPDGAMDVALTYDWVRFKQDMTMGGQKMSMEYDSAHPTDATAPRRRCSPPWSGWDSR